MLLVDESHITDIINWHSKRVKSIVIPKNRFLRKCSEICHTIEERLGFVSSYNLSLVRNFHELAYNLNLTTGVHVFIHLTTKLSPSNIKHTIVLLQVSSIYYSISSCQLKMCQYSGKTSWGSVFCSYVYMCMYVCIYTYLMYMSQSDTRVFSSLVTCSRHILISMLSMEDLSRTLWNHGWLVLV